MAVSTWFHGSQWPPGYHGIMPAGQLQRGDAAGRGQHLVGGEHAGEVGEVAAVHALLRSGFVA